MAGGRVGAARRTGGCVGGARPAACQRAPQLHSLAPPRAACPPTRRARPATPRRARPPARAPARQAFSSYLLIAWVSTNVIFVAAATILSNSTWETCAMTESEMAVNAVKARGFRAGPGRCVQHSTSGADRVAAGF